MEKSGGKPTPKVLFQLRASLGKKRMALSEPVWRQMDCYCCGEDIEGDYWACDECDNVFCERCDDEEECAASIDVDNNSVICKWCWSEEDEAQSFSQVRYPSLDELRDAAGLWPDSDNSDSDWSPSS